jgi:hypothetical protein
VNTEINDPAIIEYIEREADKTMRVLRIGRYHDLPRWALARVQYVFRSHHPSPMFTLKSADDGGAPWVMYHYRTFSDDDWTLEVLLCSRTVAPGRCLSKRRCNSARALRGLGSR